MSDGGGFGGGGFGGGFGGFGGFGGLGGLDAYAQMTDIMLPEILVTPATSPGVNDGSWDGLGGGSQAASGAEGMGAGLGGSGAGFSAASFGGMAANPSFAPGVPAPMWGPDLQSRFFFNAPLVAIPRFNHALNPPPTPPELHANPFGRGYMAPWSNAPQVAAINPPPNPLEQHARGPDTPEDGVWGPPGVAPGRGGGGRGAAPATSLADDYPVPQADPSDPRGTTAFGPHGMGQGEPFIPGRDTGFVQDLNMYTSGLDGPTNIREWAGSMYGSLAGDPAYHGQLRRYGVDPLDVANEIAMPLVRAGIPGTSSLGEAGLNYAAATGGFGYTPADLANDTLGRYGINMLTGGVSGQGLQPIDQMMAGIPRQDIQPFPEGVHPIDYGMVPPVPPPRPDRDLPIDYGMVPPVPPPSRPPLGPPSGPSMPQGTHGGIAVDAFPQGVRPISPNMIPPQMSGMPMDLNNPLIRMLMKV